MTVHTVDRIDVFSLAVVVGTIGFVWGIILTITWVVAAALGAAGPGVPELLVSTIGAAISGFIAGGVTAILYNAAASLVGGLELDLSTAG